MKTIFLISILMVAPTLAQELKPKPVELIAVKVVTDERDDDAVSRELHRAFKLELNKLRVGIRQRGADWKVYLNGVAISSHGQTVGYAGAVMVLSESHELYWLVIKTGPTLEIVASEMASSLNEEVFHRRK